MARTTNHTFLYTHLMRWEPLVLPGSKSNTWVKTLAKDNETGARTLLIKLDPGYKQDKAISTWPADMYVLEGAMTSGDRSYEPGTYHYRPGGAEFGPISSPGGITWLVFTADSKDQNSADEVFVQDVNTLPWTPSYAEPDLTKRGLKVLRKDEDAQMVVLIHGHFVTGTIMPGEGHIHDHHEECFTLRGDNEDYLADVDGHMMWVPGTYVCREIGASLHGDAMKKTAPQEQILRRGWVGETEKFWDLANPNNVRSALPPAVAWTE